MAKAIEEHQAWLSVDLMSPNDEQPDLSAAYLKIGQAIAELADENTLAVLRPETLDINVWSPEVIERLTTPGAYEELSEFDNVPVVRIDNDDPALIEAVESAQRRWPEFRAAF